MAPAHRAGAMGLTGRVGGVRQQVSPEPGAVPMIPVIRS